MSIHEPQAPEPQSHPSASEILDFRACPVCGGPLIEIRQKRQCARCHTICETCCEGGRE